MRRLGVVGGLGPESTIDYYKTLVEVWRRERPDGSYHLKSSDLPGFHFIVGPDAPPSERNILGVARKVGLEVVRK